MAGTTLFTWGVSNVDSLLATTREVRVRTLADAIFNRIPMFQWLKQKSQVKYSGGASIIVPIMTGKNSTAKPYSGYGTLDTSAQEGISAAQYKWAQYGATVTISGLEIMQNMGKEAIISLVDSKFTQAEMSLADKLDIDLLATAQATNGVLNLPSVVDTTTAIGDVAKSGNTWWQSQVTASGSMAAQGLSDMKTLYNNIFNQSVENNGAPNFGLTTQNVYQFYEGLVQPQLRITDNKMADAGFENLRYKGMTLTFDGNVPSGVLFMLRTDNCWLAVHSGRDFVSSPFIQPTNQDAKTSQILFMGQLVTDNPRKLGKLTGVTA